MVRVKGGKFSQKRRRHILEYVKGFHWQRKSKLRKAKVALYHAWTYAFRDRKAKKRDFRGLWQIQINAAVRPLGLSYSKFIHGLRNSKIELDRKVLSQLAQKQPEIFSQIVEKA